MKRLPITPALATAALLLATAAPGHATLIPLALEGKGGSGLLAANENHAVNGTPGTGGAIGDLTFDDVTNVLTLNIGYGSSQGFTDLTGPMTGLHIHGPVAGADPFSENAGVSINISGGAAFTLNDLGAGGGTVTGSVDLDDIGGVSPSDLLGGLLYVNVHTANNPGGEIRGNLTAVPEPSTYAAGLGLAALLGALLARRRRR